MNDDDKTLGPVEVIRCVYLAREAQRRGNADAASRWQSKADAWLRQSSWTSKSGPEASRMGPQIHNPENGH